MPGQHVVSRPGRWLPSNERLRTLGVLVGVGVLAVVGLVTAAVRPAWQITYRPFTLPTPHLRTTPTPPPQPTGFPTGSAIRAVPQGAYTGVLTTVLIALGLAVLALLAILVLRNLRRQALDDAAEDAAARELLPQLPVLRRGVAEAERRLLRGGDPTNAIITAWLALEEAAISSGVQRRPSQTPTEFTLAVIERTEIDAAPVRELLRLYHRARFSVDGSPPDDLAAARRCVSELAAAWQDYDLRADDPDPDPIGPRRDRGPGDRP